MTSSDAVGGGLRVADLLVPLSMVTDLGMGAADEHSARSCLLATALARRMGLSEPTVAGVYYTTLLQHLGCTATAHDEASHLSGDEIASRRLLSRVDESRPGEMLSLLASIGGGRGPVTRARTVAGAISGWRWGPGVQRAVCEVASLLAARLGMSEMVREAIGQTFERWDGKGPLGLTSDAIALPARLASVATRATTHYELGGREAAIDSVRRSRGGWLDPEAADVFIEHGRALLSEIESSDAFEAALEQEPEPRRSASERAVEEIAEAFADMTDLKCSFTIGHSPGVARLAREAAPRVGLGEEETAHLYLAALLHDLGRVGVPSGTWEKPGQLSTADWERMRLHPYYTERILARCRAVEGVAAIAGLHHERLDGSGYHRGSKSRDLPVTARLLAAADAFQGKTQARPHRPALSPEAAAETVTEEARLGRLDVDAVAAVLEAAGASTARVARTAPAGLTDREVEVLRAMADGCSNREIAERLVISPRTAEHHVQHIYEKIGLSTRAGAVMFAMQHDLLAPPLSS